MTSDYKASKANVINQLVPLRPPKPLMTLNQWIRFLNRESDKENDEMHAKMSQMLQNLNERITRETERVEHLLHVVNSILASSPLKKNELSKQIPSEMNEEPEPVLVEMNEQPEPVLVEVNEQPEPVLVEVNKQPEPVLVEVNKQPEPVLVEVNEQMAEITQLKEQLVQLEEENSTLRSQIQYLLELFSSFFAKKISVLTNSWNSFFKINKESAADASFDEQEPNKYIDFQNLK